MVLIPEVGIQIDGAWVDAVAVGGGVRTNSPIKIDVGRPNWADDVDPSKATFELDNNDGRWSPDNPNGPYYGKLKRNTPCRIGLPGNTNFLRWTGGTTKRVASTPDIAGTGGGSPTAPAHSSVVESSETSTTTSHDVLLPATLAAGDRITIAGNLGHETWTAPSEIVNNTNVNWTLAWSSNLYTPWNGLLIYVSDPLDSDGATALQGATITFTSAVSALSSWQAIRTTGTRAGGSGTAWQVAADTTTTFSSSPNPPSLTTSWGDDEHRWYAFAFFGSGADDVSSSPYIAGYTDVADGDSATNLQIASAHTTSSSTTEDPGAMTLTGDENWRCVTLVFRAEEDTSSDGALDSSADLDLRIDLELEHDLVEDLNETFVHRVTLASKTSGRNGFWWRLMQFNGNIVAQLSWYDSSGSIQAGDTTASGGVVPREVLWERMSLRVTLDADNGAGGHDVSFYYSDSIDGTWTQIGSTVTQSGTTSIKTNDAPLYVGGYDGGFLSDLGNPGRIYKYEQRHTIDGALVANPDFTAQSLGASGFTDSSTRVWTITDGEITNTEYRFQGEIAAFRDSTTVGGHDAVVPIEAQGLFRRLAEGYQYVESSIRRAIIDAAGVEDSTYVQYWPLEEPGDLLTAFGAAIGSSQFAVTGGTPSAATNSDFFSSGALPTLGDAQAKVNVDDYTETTSWQVRWLMSVPSSFSSSNVVAMEFQTTDMRFELLHTTSGGLRLIGYRGGEVYNSGSVSFDVLGKPMRFTLNLEQNGSSVDISLLGQVEGQTTAGGFITSAAVTGSVGKVTGITLNPNSAVGDWAFGHVTLQNATTAVAELTTELNAHNGERAARRIERLCYEEGIQVRIEGDPDATEKMGYQRPGKLLDLLRQCAQTDLGVLYEARESSAVAYRTRESMLDQNRKTLPGSSSNLNGWWSTQDLTTTADQTLVNRVVGGSSLTMGSSSSADNNDPVLTVGTASRMTPDGTDDYVQIPYTPSFTQSSGELTVVVVGNYHTSDTADAENRYASFETAADRGFCLHSSGAATNRVRARLGSSTPTVLDALGPVKEFADGELFTIAGQIDDGVMRAWVYGEGFGTDVNISAIGTIPHGVGKLFARGDGAANFAHSAAQELVIFERALTNTELTAVAEWLMRRHITGQISLDYSAGELGAPPMLTRDTSGFANDVTVKNSTGATARAELDDGSALSVSLPPTGVGPYQREFDANGQDDRMQALATTRLALTSVDEPRLSSLVLPLHHPEYSGTLGDDVRDMSLGDLITVWRNNPNQLGNTQIQQIVQAASETLGPIEHILSVVTTPASPWNTTVGSATGAPVVVDPPATHSVAFRTQRDLATSGQPVHVLEALGYTGSYPVTRAQIDTILDDWVAGTGGTTHNVTSSAEWTTAIGNAVPGDLVRVTSGFDATLNVRGNKYGISGGNLTSSTLGGSPGLPIIVTCADGEYVDDNDTTAAGDVGLDLQNCSHVWAVGFNVRDCLFGIRAQNWGGSEGFPAYIAYCDVDTMGDAGITAAGWFQAIASSGGTPPAGSGNEWGFSEHLVIESNTITNVGVRTGTNPGEGIYLGLGSSPGWVGHAKNFNVRGNDVTEFTSDALDLKPGCHFGLVSDNAMHGGYASLGAPMSISYVGAVIDDRPSWFNFDPLLYVEGNRVWDVDLTSTSASSVHIMAYLGISGIRCFNNLFWAKPETGTHAMFRMRNEKGTNATEALAEFGSDPLVVVNNTLWGDDTWENAGYGNPFVGTWPSTVTDSWDFRNNICDQASPATGEVDASASDFIATVPAIGVAGEAVWETYGSGSAFDLALDSSLIGSGASIADLTLQIDEDISQRSIDKSAPNPGAFQPHPSNIN